MRALRRLWYGRLVYLKRPILCGSCGARIWSSEDHLAIGVSLDLHYGCRDWAKKVTGTP